LRFETFAQIAAELERSGAWNPAAVEAPLLVEPAPAGSLPHREQNGTQL